MTEKYRVNEIVRFNYSDIGEYIDENHTDKPLRNDEVAELLNELHEENENLKDVNVQCCNDYSAMRRDVLRYKEENEQLKQFKDTTFVLINEMIETANLYRTPIKSLDYGDDLGYWNGVYQKLKELKEILFEKGDVE